nr:MAG TPA: hypothetical protein [Microviridae sp.]
MSGLTSCIIFFAILFVIRIISILLHNTKIIFHKKLK